MPSPVLVVPYDAAWPSVFEELRSDISQALGRTAIEILHVGSTAVPGLAAKPTIDIDVVIRSEADLAKATEQLATIGYRFEGDLGIPGRYAFQSPPAFPIHHHHLYVCASDNRELKRHVAFRDFLRSNPKAAEEYAALKCRLAAEHGSNRDSYSNGKAGWVEAALENHGAFHDV